MNLNYLFFRLLRKFLPETLISFLLQRGVFLKPGLETSHPKQALSLYLNVLVNNRISVNHKKCLIFGYGGNFGWLGQETKFNLLC